VPRRIEILSFFIVAGILYGCINKPFQPTPPAFKTWTKVGVSEEDVKQAMLNCGYPNVGGFAGTKYTPNEVAHAEQCMFRKGFRFKDDWKGICSLRGGNTLSECRE
jgi:hypothetical protein